MKLGDGPGTDAVTNAREGVSAHTRRVPWRWLLAFLGFWTFFGLLNAYQFYLGMRAEGMDHDFTSLAVWQLLGWWPWAGLTPVVLWLGRRSQPETASPLRVIAVHLPAVACIAALHTAYFVVLTMWLEPWGPMRAERSFLSLFAGRLSSQFHLYLIIYWAVVGAGYAFDYYRRFRERETQAAQLQAQLAQAQLQALRMQLHPHFLFNTLNGIAGLVRENQNRAAVQMLAGLSDLLRHALETAGRQEVPLREELEFLELYLNIQQMRFPDRLRVRMEIEPETLDARVPNLILQPLVENAIRHGIAPRSAPGTVGVTARRDDSLLELKVYDDGPGLGRGAQPDEDGAPGGAGGIGLRNTRARLEQLYGVGQRFEVRDRAEGGVEAKLVIPFRPSRGVHNGDEQ